MKMLKKVLQVIKRKGWWNSIAFRKPQTYTFSAHENSIPRQSEQRKAHLMPCIRPCCTVLGRVVFLFQKSRGIRMISINRTYYNFSIIRKFSVASLVLNKLSSPLDNSIDEPCFLRKHSLSA